MPTLMPTDTRNALGTSAEKCDSRSLLLDRFVDPTAKEAARKQVFTRAMSKPPIRTKQDGWQPFLSNGLGLKTDDLLFGKLQARLMVNMAGGVMENAGLCLDRFGIPYIPGSAVKGCARRFAIQTLLEATPDRKTALLVDIALVFGWSDLEWRTKADLRPRRNETDEDFQRRWEQERPDFAYACGDALWNELSGAVMTALANQLKIPITRNRQNRIELPSFAGSVSFLPAYPVQAPNPDLELDVVTCHHRDYYACELSVAIDTEEPVPVVFPAVAPGHIFAFAVVSLRNCDAALLNQARTWLHQGLETFGVGAKTAAGYGWFDCSEKVQSEVKQEVERLLTEFRKKQADAEAKAQAEEKARAEKERLDKAPPHEKFKAEYARLGDEPFAAQAKKYAEMTDDQRHGFVLALKEKRETAKRWAKKKPELIKPWQEFAKKLQPPVELP